MGRWAREHEYDEQVAAVAVELGLEPAIIKALIATESAFEARSTRQEPKIHDYSVGLVQILTKTAKVDCGYDGPLGSPEKLDGLFEPLTNIRTGAKYLKAQILRAGSLDGGFSAYNGGWRPTSGFGKPSDKWMQVCLARDQKSGKCIKYRDVHPGEYANQPYVNKVKRALDYFRGRTG
jgi:soluble lytic murein transglycosylase-like protein